MTLWVFDEGPLEASEIDVWDAALRAGRTDGAARVQAERDLAVTAAAAGAAEARSQAAFEVEMDALEAEVE